MDAGTLADKLKQLAADDAVTVRAGGNEYAGVVIECHYEPAGYPDGFPKRGSLSVGIELNNETVERHGLDSHHLNLGITERRPGEWTDADASLWVHVVEDGEIVGEEYQPLGDITGVEAEQ